MIKWQNAVRNGTDFTKLNPLDCPEQYSPPFGDRPDSILITRDTNNANNSLLACGTRGAVEKALIRVTILVSGCADSQTLSAAKGLQRTGTRARIKNFRPSLAGMSQATTAWPHIVLRVIAAVWSTPIGL